MSRDMPDRNSSPRRSLLVCLALLGASAACSRPVSPDEILAADDQVFAVSARMDLSRLRTLLAPGYVHVHAATGGRETRDSYLEFLRVRLKVTDPPKLSERTVISYDDDTAVLVGRARVDVEVDGRPIRLDNRYIRTYVRQDGRWLLASSQSSAVK
jgi:hypothetical protein